MRVPQHKNGFPPPQLAYAWKQLKRQIHEAIFQTPLVYFH